MHGLDGQPATGLAATAVTVTVDESGTLDTFFGKILGVDTLNPAESATARTFGANNLGGLRPFIVCLSDAQQARDESLDLGNEITHQSYYAKPNNASTPPTAVTLLQAGATWDAADVITTQQKHNLNVGDYLWIETDAVGASDGYYYVKTTPTNKKFTVSATRGGTTVDITTAGTADVYTLTPVGGGNSIWAVGGTVTTADAHGLSNGDRVRASVGAGLVGASDDYYYVAGATTNTFTLSLTPGGLAINHHRRDGQRLQGSCLRNVSGRLQPLELPSELGLLRVRLPELRQPAARVPDRVRVREEGTGAPTPTRRALNWARRQCRCRRRGTTATTSRRPRHPDPRPWSAR